MPTRDKIAAKPASIGTLVAMIVLINANARAAFILVSLFALNVVAVFFDSSSAGAAPALVPEAEPCTASHDHSVCTWSSAA